MFLFPDYLAYFINSVNNRVERSIGADREFGAWYVIADARWYQNLGQSQGRKQILMLLQLKRTLLTRKKRPH